MICIFKGKGCDVSSPITWFGARFSNQPLTHPVNFSCFFKVCIHQWNPWGDLIAINWIGHTATIYKQTKQTEIQGNKNTIPLIPPSKIFYTTGPCWSLIWIESQRRSWFSWICIFCPFANLLCLRPLPVCVCPWHHSCHLGPKLMKMRASTMVGILSDARKLFSFVL